MAISQDSLCPRISFLQVPEDMAAPDLVKSLNNRGRVYVKLNKMDLAEADASEVSFPAAETARCPRRNPVRRYLKNIITVGVVMACPRSALHALGARSSMLRVASLAGDCSDVSSMEQNRQPCIPFRSPPSLCPICAVFVRRFCETGVVDEFGPRRGRVGGVPRALPRSHGLECTRRCEGWAGRGGRERGAVLFSCLSQGCLCL